MEPIESGDPHSQRKVDNEHSSGGQGRGGAAYRIRGFSRSEERRLCCWNTDDALAEPPDSQPNISVLKGRVHLLSLLCPPVPQTKMYFKTFSDIISCMCFCTVFKNHCYPHNVDEKRNWVLEKISNFRKCRAGIQARPVVSNL